MGFSGGGHARILPAFRIETGTLTSNTLTTYPLDLTSARGLAIRHATIPTDEVCQVRCNTDPLAVLNWAEVKNKNGDTVQWTLRSGLWWQQINVEEVLHCPYTRIVLPGTGLTSLACSFYIVG